MRNQEKEALMLTEMAVRSAFSRPLFGRARRGEARLDSHAPADSFELIGVPTSFAGNAEIYGEAEPADYLYKVISGAVRTYRVLIDGRRQIGAFYLPNDIFGLEVA